MFSLNDVGERVRRLRLVSGLGQIEFAEKVGIANGSVSKLENGRMMLSDDLLESIATALGCTSTFLSAPHQLVPTTRPWLRAYADASKRAVDAQVSDCTFAIEVIDRLDLRTIPDTIPAFRGDLADDGQIEQFALEVRAAAQINESDVVGNTIRAAERLGCIVLPMREELGRHLGLSVRANLLPVICVSRPSADPARHVPGDRQRFTVAHEIGHLALHGTLGPPQSSEESARVERQAHHFAGAFLTPADALLEDLSDLGGRVTLRTLALLKTRWGVAIKALVMRLRSLNVIDADQARSLYKQISSRGWNSNEPVPVGNESAIWLARSLDRLSPPGSSPHLVASSAAGIAPSHFTRWIDWSPTGSGAANTDVISLDDRRGQGRPQRRGMTARPLRKG